METNNRLNRIAVKLYKLLLSGADLSEESRWIYDWDDNLSTSENLINVATEDKALTTLTVAGIIKTKHISNSYRDYPIQHPGIPVVWQARWGDMDEPDSALREYDRVRFIEAFYYDKFIQFCEEQGINYKEDGIVATLTIEMQRPIVHAGGAVYTLKSLTVGSTLEVVEHIQANLHYNKPTTFDDLRRWLKNPQAFKEQNNFKQIYRDDNIFQKDNALSPFADIQPRYFTLRSKVLLTPRQLSAIQKNSIK